MKKHDKANAEMIVEDATAAALEKTCKALAEMWINGEQVKVRDVIAQTLNRELRVVWANGVRKNLEHENMKDAFDQYMKGSI